MRAEINLYNEDCLQAMKAMQDKQFDLAIVDPPYGIGESSKNFASRSKLANADKYTIKEWDSAIPTGEYFNELKRVSKNQIIWGWNYFVSYLNECPSYIVWNKLNGANDFADCESAWCSKKGAARVFEWRWAIRAMMSLEKVRNVYLSWFIQVVGIGTTLTAASKPPSPSTNYEP